MVLTSGVREVNVTQFDDTFDTWKSHGRARIVVRFTINFRRNFDDFDNSRGRSERAYHLAHQHRQLIEIIN